MPTVAVCGLLGSEKETQIESWMHKFKITDSMFEYQNGIT
jgi:hypothetical protein